MTQVLIHDGKLDRQAAADALRQFLENVVRVSKLELKVNVRPISAEGEGSGGGAEVLADIDGKDKEILLEHGGEVLKRSSTSPCARCGWNRPTMKRFTSIAAAT